MARYDRADRRINRILDGRSPAAWRGVTRWSVAAIVALGLPLAYLAAGVDPGLAKQAPNVPASTVPIARVPATALPEKPLVVAAPVVKRSSKLSAMAPVDRDNQEGDSKSQGDSPAPAPPDAVISADLPAILYPQPEIQVRPGDTLFINVWKEPEVSSQVVVRGDCRITLNPIHDQEVCGMTPTQVQALLTEKLSKFIADPDVTVTLTGLQSRKVHFINFRVPRPGGMILNGPPILDAPMRPPGPSAKPPDYSKMPTPPESGSIDRPKPN
jgi:hypothetical protein